MHITRPQNYGQYPHCIGQQYQGFDVGHFWGCPDCGGSVIVRINTAQTKTMMKRLKPNRSMCVANATCRGSAAHSARYFGSVCTKRSSILPFEAVNKKPKQEI
jgi:hypothetical protein